MTSRQEMQEQETFVFESRVSRIVTYRQHHDVQVEARCEEDADLAIAEACQHAFGDEYLPDSIEVKVTRPDGSRELEAFVIYGGDDYPEQGDHPVDYDSWESDGCEPHTGYEEAQAAAKDQAKCRQRNPELFEAPAAASKLRQYDEAIEYRRMANPELPRHVPRNEFGRVTWQDTWPGTAKALCDRGLIEAASGNHADAVTWFDGAISKDYKYVRAYYHRGLSCAALGVHSRAKADLQTAFILESKR